jgi:hypothetical protein
MLPTIDRQTSASVLCKLIFYLSQIITEMPFYSNNIVSAAKNCYGSWAMGSTWFHPLVTWKIHGLWVFQGTG